MTQTQSKLGGLSNDALILSLDQGGHSSRAIVFDRQGSMLASARYKLGVSRPQPDWVEQDAAELRFSMEQVLQDMTRQLGQDCARIQVAGLATQRSNSVCWHRTSKNALSKVISWQDTRTCKQLLDYQHHAKPIHEKTGLYVTAHYGATKFLWCLDHLPEVAAANAAGELAWGPLSSYLAMCLTEGDQHYVDPANASRTLLWNLATLTWDDQLLSWFKLPRQPLPRCTATFFPFGRLSLVANTRDTKEVNNVVELNVVSGAFIQCYTGSILHQVPGILSGIACHDGHTPHYTLEGTVNGAGSALSLVEEQLGMDYRYAEANFETWLAKNDNLPLFLNGVSGLGTPYWVPDFASRFSEEAEDWKKIVAVAESILFLIMVNLERLREAGIKMDRILLTGGLANTDALCQRLADLVGFAVVRPRDCEATARGTACLAAGLPTGWQDTQARIFDARPNQNLIQRYRAWYQAMEQALSDSRSGLVT